MKHVKKILCLMLALVLVLGMGVTVLAAETGNMDQTYTILVPEDDTHTYVVYQIFTGDYDAGSDVLSNIRWGRDSRNYAATKEIQDLVSSDILKELENKAGSSDKDKLALITTYWDKDSAGQEIPETKKLTVPAGYYLIKDKDKTVTGDDAYTAYIVQVAGDDVTISRKAAKPTVDKQVADDSDAAEEGWNETADYAIGESFQFKLTAAVPVDKNLAVYETYKLVFHDTMSDGVTFEKIDNVKVNDTFVTDYSCTAIADQNGGSWTLTIEDLKAVNGVDLGNSAIIVEVLYSAHLNESAVVNKEGGNGLTGNNNAVELEYSNNPNAEGTGKTEKDTVFVFTYESDHTKIDGSSEDKIALQGVTFKLYSDKDCESEVSLIYDENKSAYRPVMTGETGTEMTSDADGKFNIIGLDAGIYYLKEIQELPGYNKLDGPVEITISATRPENAGGTGADLTLTRTKTDNKDSLEIENYKGSVLPETGGIGTTIFYVLGSILVLGCGVILITRKRMSKSE